MKKIVIFALAVLLAGCAKNTQSLNFKDKNANSYTLQWDKDFKNAVLIIKKPLSQAVSASGIRLQAKDGSEIHFKAGKGGVYTPASKEQRLEN